MRIRISLLVLALTAGCVQMTQHSTSQSQGTTAVVADAKSQAGWRPLFDGTSTSGWRGYKSETVPSGWTVIDGVLTKNTSTDDIVSKEQFGDFELELEWKLGTGGNAGIFYRGTEEYDHIYWSAPEYQLLDDANAPDGRSRLTSAGAAYGLYPSPVGVVKPANEWNSTRIVVKGGHVEHWLNGQKLLEYELWSPDWEAKVKASKFGEWPNYGRAKSGYLAIQGDHDGKLELRGIRIRELR
ncbi:MAG: DUF1080 domain-containing protein [Gemmatimonadota bacterium]|nr:DUF1080 domain-containing protein [Gemmatimonadota bacterium]